MTYHIAQNYVNNTINALSLFIPAISEGLYKIQIALYGNQAQGKQNEKEQLATLTLCKTALQH